MVTMAANRRSVKNVLVNRPLQREFTLFMIVIMMTAGIIVGLMIHFTLTGMTEGSPGTLSRLALERMIADANAQLIMGTVLTIFISVIVTGWFGIFFLHRVAGPVYRFRQVLKQISAGELPRKFKLRERDFFKETGAELNRVIQLLRQQEEASKEMESLLSANKGKTLSPDVCDKIREIQKIGSPFKAK
jgi:methyl-accepting chemotaxis protein